MKTNSAHRRLAISKLADPNLRTSGVQTIPVARLTVPSPRLDQFFDERYAPMRNRIRAIEGDAERLGSELASMATMFRAGDGEPLRTFSGGLAHENGWLPCLKAERLLHWEGEAQRALVIRSESDFGVVQIATESMALEFPLNGRLARYTCDVELLAADGSIFIWEVKRDERDLADPEFCQKLAAVKEILRRCDIGFGVIFRREIFQNRIHRANAELFASRAMASVRREHLLRLENFALRFGPSSTYGELAETLDPTSRQTGLALLQALAVRRRVEIAISHRLRPDTPVTIH